MSTLVTAEFFAQPGRGDDVANLLIEILGESLQHDGCEIIRIVRDQDDPDHVAGVTQWTARHNYDDYLAWRTEQGDTATFEAMLTGRSSFTTTTSRISAKASLQPELLSTDVRTRICCNSNRWPKAAPLGRRVAAPLSGDLTTSSVGPPLPLPRRGRRRPPHRAVVT